MSDEGGFETARKVVETVDTSANFTESIGRFGGSVNGKPGVMPGPIDTLTKPFSAVASGYNLGHGTYQLATGIDNGNATQIVNGVHDVTSGALGAAALAGPIGWAASFGFGVGDLICKGLDQLLGVNESGPKEIDQEELDQEQAMIAKLDEARELGATVVPGIAGDVIIWNDGRIPEYLEAPDY